MRRTFLGTILAALLVPSLVSAAPMVWTKTSTRSVKGVCAAGTSCDAPVDSVTSTDGMMLVGVSGYTVKVCSDTGQTITDAIGFTIYYWDEDGSWAQPAADSGALLTLSTTDTGKHCYVFEGQSPAHGIPVVSSRGRIAIIPTNVAVSSGAITVYLYAVAGLGNVL